MTRRDFLGAAASALAASQPASSRPNFLILLCDDLGYGDLGCYGNRIIRTPNLDRLASEGVRFTSFYASAPVCSPSRAGLLTGRTPYRSGIYDWIPAGSPMHLPASEVTVAALLKKAGYATSHAGKWHCNGKFNSPEQPQPGDHGFDHWFSTQNNAAPSHRNPANFLRNGKPAGELEGYSCQIVVDEAIAWLKRRDPGKPFFLHVCFHEPHEPVDSPPKDMDLYPEAKKRGEALYYANVTNMDAAAGRLLTALDEMHLRDSTFVLFTSDNGPETLNRYPDAWRSHGTPGPLRGMKLHLYEGGIRVPGIVRWPGRTTAGHISDEPVVNTDMLPTLCAIAGVEQPAGRVIDGASILPALEGRPVSRKRPLYWQYDKALGGPRVAIREGDWKLLAHRDLARFELYNLRADVTEKHDLASAEPGRVKQMAEVLAATHREVKAEGPKWPGSPG
jgi:arylsulfatase A